MKGFAAMMVCLGGLVAAPVHADPASAMAVVNRLPGVVRAAEDNAGNLWVMVNTQPGLDWSTYAAKVCQIVRQHHARIFLVKIVDMRSVQPKKKPKDWTMVGGANCASVP